MIYVNKIGRKNVSIFLIKKLVLILIYKKKKAQKIEFNKNK